MCYTLKYWRDDPYYSKSIGMNKIHIPHHQKMVFSAWDIIEIGLQSQRKWIKMYIQLYSFPFEELGTKPVLFHEVSK